MLRSRFLLPFAALLAMAAAVPVFFGPGSSAQPEADAPAFANPAPSASAELRIWQRVRAPHGLWVSARPGADSPWTTTAVELDLRAGPWRGGGLTVEARAGEIELRLWRHAGLPTLVYLSARPAGGSWNEYGTRRLELDGLSRSGRFRYAHLAVALAWPDAEPPLPGAEPVALCVPDGLETESLQARVWRSVAAPPRYWISARPDGDSAWRTSAVPLAAADGDGDGLRAGGLTVDAGMAVFELRLWERGSAVHLSARVAATPWDEFATRPLDLGQTSASGRFTYENLDVVLTLPEPEPPLPGEERTWECPAEGPEADGPEPGPTPEPANEPPQADAGSDQTVDIGDAVTLDGGGSADPDGDELAFAWTGPDGVSLAGADTATPSFTATAAHAGRTLTFRLIVTDPGGLSASDTVEVEVRPRQAPITAPPVIAPPPNRPPTADAGDDVAVERTRTATLDGSGSSDPDGSLTYAWRQTAGTTVTLSSTSVAKPTFTVPQTAAIGDAYTFTLTVSDGALSATDTVTITAANALPTASAGADATVNRTATATLDGSASDDPDGSLTYAWRQTAGTTVTLSSTTAAKPTFTVPAGADVNEQLAFSLTVTDADSAADTAAVTITAANALPTASAGADATVNRTATATLDGSASDDPDGSLTYAWRQTAGTTVTLSSTTAAKPTFTVPAGAAVNEPLAFSLTVTDADSATATAAVTITAANAPPDADAGADKTVAPEANVVLDGSGSSDPEKSTLTFAWAKTDESTYTGPIQVDTGTSVSFNVPYEVAAGQTIVMRLTVTDENGGSGALTDTDEVTFTQSNANRRPSVTLADATAIPGQALSLSATVDDPDGDNTKITYDWNLTNAPTSLLGDRTTATPTLAVPTGATKDTAYAISLTVTDEDDATDSDSMTVTVTNTAPTADAGDDQSVDRNTTATLNGSGSSDPDSGDTLTYAWSQTAGTSVTLSSTSVAKPTFTVPQTAAIGDAYTFTLTVSDGTNSDTADVTVTAKNALPTAEAGDAKTAAAGAKVTLSGSGSDPDGTTITYQWSAKVPTTLLEDSNTATPTLTIPADKKAGDVITLKLVVTDEDGETATDTTTVTVTAAN